MRLFNNSPLSDAGGMDLNPPQMSGIECIRKLKEILPKTPVIVLTVYEDSEHIFRALTHFPHSKELHTEMFRWQRSISPDNLKLVA